MSEQQRPKRVVLQEVLRPAPCVGRRLVESEDMSATNRLLAQLRAAAPSAQKGNGGTTGGNAGGKK